MILQKYKNNLLTIIQESGIDPNLFTAENRVFDNIGFFTISLRDSSILFAICPWENRFDDFRYRRSLFQAGFAMSELLYGGKSERLFEIFKDWLNSVVIPYLDDVRTPDFWQILEETRSHTKHEVFTPDDFNSFSDGEKIQIRLTIKEFRLLIMDNFNPNQEHLKAVDARLEYLSDAIDKHNKFDWKGIAIHTVMAITIALSLSPEQGHQLFELFRQIFSNILYLLS